jgi:hypothetical protein
VLCLDFRCQINPNVPPHLITDNYATRKHPRVNGWPALRLRFHAHFTPPYVSHAQSGGDLVQPHHPTDHPLGSFPQRVESGHFAVAFLLDPVESLHPAATETCAR